MNREFLKEQGLTDEQIEAVMKEHGKTVNSIKDKADKVDGLESQIKDLDNQIQERDNQLEELKKIDVESLQQTIEELQNKNKTQKEEYEEKIEKQAFEFTLERALNKAEAKNPKAVKALLDTDSIKLDGETLLGLDDQLTALKESDAYLFGEDEPAGLKGRKPHEGGASTQGIKNPWSKEHFNLTEQGRLLREDPELAKQLQGKE